ncbi:MAG: FAD-binding protein [Schwartzia sp.]|nr:FAD-binding protein [Schwartzia sp. (in: firmicutes)]
MIRISGLSVPIADLRSLEEIAAERLSIRRESVRRAEIVRRAVDARRRHGAPICFSYMLDVETEESEGRILGRFRRDKKISAAPEAETSVFSCLVEGKNFVPEKRPVVVGFGPAGMFAALALAAAGCAPLVVERGQDVDARHAAIDKFWSGGALDTETNVQFGEGGAGTFSDGKLTARGGDPLQRDIIDAFIRAGAPEEIRYLAKPHIGTDRLREVVKNIRAEILRLGGEIRFGMRMEMLEAKAGKVSGVRLSGGERIDTDTVFLAIGHSARDTYRMLYESGVAMEAKAFAVGVRVEHPQEIIDRAQYGEDAGNPRLGAADYALTFQDTVTGRGAYSFCMCPGGQVVAAASEAGRVVTNGMSLYARNSGVANAALLVQVRPEDFGGEVLGGVAFQREYEAAAFRIAGGDYRAPVQSVGDFLRGASGSMDFCVAPTYRPGVVPCRLDDCLPSFVTRTLRDAFPAFDAKIAGFAAEDVPLTGVEMRSSSPCRILRDRESFVSLSTPGLYPVGEGAGYAGGIMSAAVDGLKAALAFLKKNATI